MKRIISLIVFALLISTLSFAQQESTPVTSSMGSVGFTASDVFAQSFIASTNTITEIGMWIQENSAEGQVKLALYSDNAGKPDYLAPLYTGSLINPTAVGQWYYETGLSIAVTAGQKYYIGVYNDGLAGTTGNSRIGLSGTATSSGLGAMYSNSSGATWIGPIAISYAIFVKYSSPPAVPVSTWSIVLGSIFIAGLIIYRKRKTSVA